MGVCMMIVDFEGAFDVIMPLLEAWMSECVLVLLYIWVSEGLRLDF